MSDYELAAAEHTAAAMDAILEPVRHSGPRLPWGWRLVHEETRPGYGARRLLDADGAEVGRYGVTTFNGHATWRFRGDLYDAEQDVIDLIVGRAAA